MLHGRFGGAGASGTPVGTGNFVYGRTTAGTPTITGSISSTNGTDGNGVFVLPSTPSPAASLVLWTTQVGTLTRLIAGVHFNLSVATITFVAGFKPIAGPPVENLYADYMIA